LVQNAKREGVRGGGLDLLSIRVRDNPRPVGNRGVCLLGAAKGKGQEPFLRETNQKTNMKVHPLKLIARDWHVTHFEAEGRKVLKRKGKRRRPRKEQGKKEEDKIQKRRQGLGAPSVQIQPETEGEKMGKGKKKKTSFSIGIEQDKMDDTGGRN